MSTNRLVTTNNTLNWDALREEKFGGAMLTGSTADSVGAISVEAKAPCGRISYKSWEENFRAAMYFIGEGTSDYHRIFRVRFGAEESIASICFSFAKLRSIVFHFVS